MRRFPSPGVWFQQIGSKHLWERGKSGEKNRRFHRRRLIEVACAALQEVQDLVFARQSNRLAAITPAGERSLYRCNVRGTGFLGTGAHEREPSSLPLVNVTLVVGRQALVEI